MVYRINNDIIKILMNTGSSSVMFLDGWNWEEMRIKPDDGIHLNIE